MKTILFPLIVTATAFLLTLLVTKVMLPILNRKHASQIVLEIGPSWHKSKEGTPTMGGIGFLLVALLLSIPSTYLLWLWVSREAALFFALTMAYATGNGMVGIIDDLTKLNHRRNEGLTPIQKLCLQGVLAIAYLVLFAALTDFSTSLRVPFLGISWNLGFLYYIFLFLFLVWFVNCGNLTDGIDGLATSVAGWIGLFFLIAGIFLTRSEVSLLGGILIGCGSGFFLFNRHPAKLFMGDTGSLFLGALAAATSCIMGTPLLFFLVGGIYLWEGLSVVLQVLYFKATKGKRLFLMAPYHHHMEKKGWSERQIMLLFSLITIFLSLIATLGVAI